MKTITTLMLVLLAFGVHAEIYKWTDEDGNVHFGDRPKNLNKAETVEIREQKTGSMVSDTQKAKYKHQTRVKEIRDTYTRKVNSLPATAAGPSRLCTFSQNKLKEKELKLDQLRKRGYKQHERAYAEDQIELWKSKVNTNCS